MPVESQDFKDALARFPSGVTVVTIQTEDGPHGMTASAFCSLSMDPPLVLVCVKKGNRTHDKLENAAGFAVNILDKSQVTHSNRFAGWPPEGEGPWDNVSHSPAPESGAPFLDGAIASLDCTLYGTREGGDHTIFIGQVENTELRGNPDDPQPLLYYRGYRGLGDKI